MSIDNLSDGLQPHLPLGLSDSLSQKLIHDASLPEPDRPPIEFWEHTLETPAKRILEDAADPAYWEGWLKRRKPRQVAMLRHLLGLPIGGFSRDRKSELHGHTVHLRRFAPAVAFAMRKSMHATLDVARGCLDPSIIAIAQEAEGSFDTTALVFAILDEAWRELEKIFHLDRLHKVGFARMRLPKPPRRPDRKLKQFLASDEVVAVLRQFDADRQDRLVSELQQVIELHGSQIVFIRRPHHQSLVLADEKVVHGFTPDQIILDFRDEAARLNVASHGHAASYEIANRVASAFYGQSCEYENISRETYAAQISRFLHLVRNCEGPDFRLVEIRVQGSPLVAALDIDLTSKDNLSIGPGLAQLEQALRWTIDDLDRVPRFKILFNDKRVGMEIEPVAGTRAPDKMYVLRYRDQTLSLGERQVFEDRMEHEYGIKVVSTEKRGSRNRKN